MNVPERFISVFDRFRQLLTFLRPETVRNIERPETMRNNQELPGKVNGLKGLLLKRSRPVAFIISTYNKNKTRMKSFTNSPIL